LPATPIVAPLAALASDRQPSLAAKITPSATRPQPNAANSPAAKSAKPKTPPEVANTPAPAAAAAIAANEPPPPSASVTSSEPATPATLIAPVQPPVTISGCLEIN